MALSTHTINQMSSQELIKTLIGHFKKNARASPGPHQLIMALRQPEIEAEDKRFLKQMLKYNHGINFDTLEA